jgi:NhaP-type Na+/H+ or K+/H+ antiporter
MGLINLSSFNVAAAALGGFTMVFCAISYFLKDGLYMSEPLPSVLFGFIFHEANWIHPSPNDEQTDSMNISRFVLGIQLTLVGVQLPAKYLKHAWKSLCVLLVGVMTVMWIASSVIIYLCIPNINFLEALIIAACITPTDPILCNSLVQGKFAEKYISHSLRRIIVAESGANDGFGYPFLFLALCIFRYSGTKIASQWIVYTVIYQIILGVAYGGVVGFIGQELVHRAHKHNLIDKESYLLSVFALALFVIGTAGLIGTDDLLACFIAGNLFTWNDEFRLKTVDDMVQATVDLVLNLAIFVWIGATVPWAAFTSLFPIWRFMVMGIALLVFRRLPAMLLFYKLTPDIKNIKEAMFAGYFGPIGVGALFYCAVCIEELKNAGLDDDSWLIQVVKPVVYFCILSSVVVHGLSIPVLRAILKFSETREETLTIHELPKLSTPIHTD